MDPKNLLVIMSDEHNSQMLGCAGHPLVKTPNLDRLAARGTRFDSAYTPCPICVPARASFATGRYVHDNECWDNAIAYDGRIESWGHRLQASGVRVESIGKLHYRAEEDPTGFDKQFIPMHIKDGVGMVHLSVRRQFPEFVPPPFQKGGGAAGIVLNAGPGESAYSGYDRQIADLACDWLRDAAARDEPWTLFVSFVTPHYPLTAPDEFFDLYPVNDMPVPKLGADSGFEAHPWLERFLGENAGSDATPEQHRRAFAAYLGLCSFMDAQIGRVLDALDEHGLTPGARIIYTSDHGENAGARGLWGKSNHYEEACGVPLIVAGPNVPEGRVCKTPTSLVDAFPSIVQCAGADCPDDGVLPGRSWFTLANQPDDPDRVVFSEYHAARSPSAAYMIRKGRYKYIHYVGFEPELFDLEADPEESTNLAKDPDHADILADCDVCLRNIVDPDAVDRQANEAQKALVLSRGGPDAVYANLVTTKHYTPAPGEAETTD
ncbi:MAG: sulfatase-like hydrolase/transferase [Alphaproteobacteria bacterium]|nr:sulfatase-like hydrolase/transferase [Alphaproteobacteria bacterium]